MHGLALVTVQSAYDVVVALDIDRQRERDQLKLVEPSHGWLEWLRTILVGGFFVLFLVTALRCGGVW